MNAPTATTAEKFALSALAAARAPRRVPRNATVNFRADLTGQVSFIHGTPVDSVPVDHVAWRVRKALELFDFAPLVARASPLGRRGLHPAHVLGPLLLGSLEGRHHCSQVARELQTNAAYRLVSGGHEMDASLLRSFRRKNLLFFIECVERTIAIAFERKYVDLEQTALDSVRIEADAATESLCTLERSSKMVKQLPGADMTGKTPEQVERHQARLAKHEAAVGHCNDMNMTSYSRTDPLAALMKFPHGGSKAGHRLTTVVAGAAIRFCIAFFLSSRPTDHGVLPGMLEALRQRLRRVGVADETVVKVAVDAGFCNQDDLTVAHANDLNVDVALAQQGYVGAGKVNAKGLFGKEHFRVEGNKAFCPAGKAMSGPFRTKGSEVRWHGLGCGKCPLRAQCTTSPYRTIRHNPVTADLRAALTERMTDPGRQALYAKRGPIVESMYSVLEDGMGFRRASSRHPATVQAEIVLKILAYNLTRLWAADAARRFWLLDLRDWPEALVEAVLDFVLDLQDTNSVARPSTGPKGQQALEGILESAGDGLVTGVRR